VKIQVLADSDAVAKKAAKLIAVEAATAAAARGHFVMGLSGGYTPWRMLCALANEPVTLRRPDGVQKL